MGPFVRQLTVCPGLAALLLFGGICGASAEPRVIVTVDVESLDDLPLPTQAAAVCRDDVPCGLQEIAHMLDERGMKGTFFLNVYEYKSWGEETLRNIAVQLQRSGHDVALHTHPQWLYDPDKPYMYSYTLEEQTRIIADGVRLLEKWTGEPVVSHRAGAYAANGDTLEALARNGIYLDNSLFFEHPESRLNELGLARNLPSTVGRVTELPVTVYERQERPSIGGSIAPPFSSIRKFDVNWFADRQEALSAIDAAVADDLPYIVMFLHSFSLIEGRAADGTLVADSHSKKIFSSMLDHVAAGNLPVVTMRELATSGLSESKAKDVVPSVASTTPVYKYAAHMLRPYFLWIAVALAVSAAALVIFVVLIGRLAQVRRRNGTASDLE